MKQERGINGRANFHAPATDSPIVGGRVVQVYSFDIYTYICIARGGKEGGGGKNDRNRRISEPNSFEPTTLRVKCRAIYRFPLSMLKRSLRENGYKHLRVDSKEK